jgi:hypothetical protein
LRALAGLARAAFGGGTSIRGNGGEECAGRATAQVPRVAVKTTAAVHLAIYQYNKIWNVT